MISMIKDRRSGKSTRLLQMAMVHGRGNRRVILSPTLGMSKYLMNYMMELSKDMCPELRHSTMEVTIHGVVFQFTSIECFTRESHHKVEVYIDELPFCLEQLLGDVKMFTGTCLRMA